ncbi:MAG: PHP domain-containing protein [Saprospiraceae bacterium]|nr:PHP domain-containing protein [Saprospiraceae bacterium]
MVVRTIVLTFLISSGSLMAQHSHEHGRKIEFPNVPGYQTLKCDFHIHSVFSDGNVWPTIRVEEAIRDGLDAISLTEHLEYQPHSADMPHEDRNRSFEIAKEFAKARDILIIHGAEITRDMPPGHANALFIQDANALNNIEDPVEAYRAAGAQGAFVFWNHPNWFRQYEDGVARMTSMHEQLIAENLLHGIEVVNDLTYSDEALQICYDHDLAVVGTSDIHGLVDWQFEIPEGGHRPIMLVFAVNRDEASIKEAMFAHRTLAYFNHHLVGREEVLNPLIEASLNVSKAAYEGPTSVAFVTIENNSDAPFLCKNAGIYRFHNFADVFEVPPHGSVEVQVKTLEQKAQFDLALEILNGVTRPGQHPTITLKVVMPKE